MEVKSVTAETLGMGAAIERLNDGFEGLLNNIHDPNTQAEAVREINLKIKIKPKKDRNSCEYQVHLTTGTGRNSGRLWRRAEVRTV